MHFVKSVVAIVTVSLVAGACADGTGSSIAAPKQPSLIVSGQPTGSDLYPNVGALLFDYDQNRRINGDDEWCSGSLITPTTFLTAAHCVVTSYTPPGTQFYVSFSADLYAKSFKYIAATGYVYDPQYGHDEAKLHDLALVFLPANSTNGLTPLRLPPAGYLDQLKASSVINTLTFVNVGYGTSATLTGAPGFPFDGKRSYSYSEFMGLQPTWLGLLMNSNATGLGGDCYGDSGGPKFIAGNASMIVATVTTGDYPCRATTWDWRLDTPEARGFLGQYVKLP